MNFTGYRLHLTDSSAPWSVFSLFYLLCVLVSSRGQSTLPKRQLHSNKLVTLRQSDWATLLETLLPSFPRFPFPFKARSKFLWHGSWTCTLSFGWWLRSLLHRKMTIMKNKTINLTNWMREGCFIWKNLNVSSVSFNVYVCEVCEGVFFTASYSLLFNEREDEKRYPLVQNDRLLDIWGRLCCCSELIYTQLLLPW